MTGPVQLLELDAVQQVLIIRHLGRVGLLAFRLSALGCKSVLESPAGTFSIIREFQ